MEKIRNKIFVDPGEGSITIPKKSRNIFLLEKTQKESIMKNKIMEITFWGTRGSLASAGRETVEFGGNTLCTSLTTNNGLVILDTGTGVRKLGLYLMDKMQAFKNKGRVFYSHVHWDHIQGFQFFGPFFKPENEFLICGPSGVAYELDKVLKGQMETPEFPITLSALPAKIRFKELQPKTYRFNGITVTAEINRHHPPCSCFSYRVSFNGSALTYATDTEHLQRESDAKIVKQAKDTDILIYDTQFTPEDYPLKKTWGHSTWVEGVKVAKKAKVNLFVPFHYDPAYSDEKIRKMEAEAQKEFPNTIASREGMTIYVVKG